ncbi:MAG TPA: sialate O-acetylesterase, partial [Chitinophagaceae bacterium]|nr:sialate O-acetylesterase [Chitinophagaceae bacterium]
DGEELTLKNVMIGEVWICSGQSNMEMPLAGWGKINDYEKEIAAADYPNIRLLQVVHATSNKPLEEAQVTNGGWQPCSPKYVAEFSSVAYFFAREIYNHKKIPIGLIHTSWGGTVAEAWTSASTLKTLPDFKDAATKVEATPEITQAQLQKQIDAWQASLLNKDAGFSQGRYIWTDTGVGDAGWRFMGLPCLWEKQGLPDFDGIVWFRKKITIPASWAGKDITVNLGTIDDDDITWFNGEKIGQTVGYTKMRKYIIPGAKVRAGESVIAVRVFDGSGGGGLYGEAKDMSMISANGERISLAGEWSFRPGLNLRDIGASPASAGGPNRPAVLYNAMIQPFIQFAIRGAIWYQGEANAGRGRQYRTLFPAMITDWRSKWGIGDFPFYFVQLANFMKADSLPAASDWAELREAQAKTLSLPNTGMAVAIDIGNPDDIHPKNKQEVGRRLALIALAKNYGEKQVYTGPVYESQKIEGGSIRLSFKSGCGELTAGGDKPLGGFAIAGADQVFHWATARIEGDKVVVSSPEVAAPVAVRYAWGNNPAGANLYNKQGLPASPFRTDDK